MNSALAQIRKAVAATVGAAGAGLLGIASAVQWNITAITEGQISGVLFLALSTGVATFALKNGVVAALIVDAEHVVADAAAVTVGRIAPLIAPVVAAVEATIAPVTVAESGAHASPAVAPPTP